MDIQAAAPVLGWVELQTAPDSSPSRQSDADAHVTALIDTVARVAECHAEPCVGLVAIITAPAAVGATHSDVLGHATPVNELSVNSVVRSHRPEAIGSVEL